MSVEVPTPTTPRPPTDAPEEPENVRRFGLPLALTVAIGTALLLTGINMALYFSSNLSRIDLSKPKYADIRKDLRPSEDASSQPKVDTTSPITKDAVQAQIDNLTKRRDELRKLGGFDSTVLDDAPLGIDAADVPAGDQTTPAAQQ